MIEFEQRDCDVTLNCQRTFTENTLHWIIVKQEYQQEASRVFAESGINLTTKGRPYLGAAIGTEKYITEYVSSKVTEWKSSISTLSEIAKSQPHAAFSALTHGLLSKWTYLSRVQPHIHHLLLPLDNVLRSDLLPSLTRRPPPNDLECALFDLPARLGGLPSRHAEREHQCSQLITAPLRDHILNQDDEYGYDILNEQIQKKAQVSIDNRQRCQEEADAIHEQLAT